MIVLIIVACVSTVGGVYGAVSWKSNAKTSAQSSDQAKLQTIRTRIVSVPLISESQVLGYLVVRLDFTADLDLLKGSSIQPEGFVADEVFRVIYESAPNDMKNARKQMLTTLSQSVVAGVNKRLGRDVVKDVLIDTWTYLSKKDMDKNSGNAR